ncbi:PilX N-terminal domain-containing pilus assembly protein [Thioalkalivibrio sp. ALE23]|uniref:pilus assembly PilX family protein n=1 Tax=Thioalkalivibrio sp. ALE23 TaxID=1265495 RepID=UPI0009D94A37|nr:PilX N-terminal domain-containing pilus assembly protein [Thioalkalivibrio sp. ALE23]
MTNRRKQSGAALAIGLILLVVATLVTLAGLQGANLQERMTGNQLSSSSAHMAAEAGASDLISYIEQYGWPESDPSSEEEFVRSVIQEGRHYEFVDPHGGSIDWDSRPLTLAVRGYQRTPDGAEILGESMVRISLSPSAGPAANAPAAISCLGDGCNIEAGAGQGADEGFGTVSGFDHPIPDLSCSGAGCRMEPEGENRDLPAVPSVYLDDPDASTIGAGGNHDPYQGLDADGNLVEGRGNDVALTKDDFDDDPDTGESTSPTRQSIFGDSEPETSLESGRTDMSELSGSDHEVGTLVVDGQDVEMGGNALFVGLIFIENCGTLDMGGNPNVYGAVIIDSTGCPDEDYAERHCGGDLNNCEYDAFPANGTPAVRYSREALDRAGGGAGSGVNVSGWSEYLR